MDNILAKAFAVSNATEQASMLNILARELFVACGGRYGRDITSSQGYEMQCCYISKDLDKDGIQLIKDLHNFILLREKDME